MLVKLAGPQMGASGQCQIRLGLDGIAQSVHIGTVLDMGRRKMSPESGEPHSAWPVCGPLHQPSAHLPAAHARGKTHANFSHAHGTGKHDDTKYMIDQAFHSWARVIDDRPSAQSMDICRPGISLNWQFMMRTGCEIRDFWSGRSCLWWAGL